MYTMLLLIRRSVSAIKKSILIVPKNSQLCRLDPVAISLFGCFGLIYTSNSTKQEYSNGLLANNTQEVDVRHAVGSAEDDGLNTIHLLL